MRGLSSVMRDAHDSSLCGGSLLGARGFAWRFSFEKRMRLRTREGYPQSCAQRMTAPSAEGAKGDSASAEAAKGLCDRPLETFAPCGGDSWQVAAALSAAVTTTKLQGTAPPFRRNQRRRKAPAERQPLFGRGGLGERRFSQRSGLSPRISPHTRLFGREREGGGFSAEKPPPSQTHMILITPWFFRGILRSCSSSRQWCRRA